jgi:hypothetical protein
MSTELNIPVADTFSSPIHASLYTIVQQLHRMQNDIVQIKTQLGCDRSVVVEADEEVASTDDTKSDIVNAHNHARSFAFRRKRNSRAVVTDSDNNQRPLRPRKRRRTSDIELTSSVSGSTDRLLDEVEGAG